MSFINRLNEAAPCTPADYIGFYVDGVRIGLIPPEFAKSLTPHNDVFQIEEGRISLSPALKGNRERTDALESVLLKLRDEGLIPGWRDEKYAIGTDVQGQSLFDMERSATGLFGVRTHAISLNGYVRRDDGLHLWTARRADDKATYPGELDLIVGGGHPAGMGLWENLIKECHEEAGIDEKLARKAVPVGGISICSEQCGQVINQFQYVYDLAMPEDFTPVNIDGEVASFDLWSIERVRDTLYQTDEFMFDSALVNIDFLIRHGIIDCEDPEYSSLVMGLRVPSLLA